MTTFPANARELKKALIDAGFQIYRTFADEVALAERVRDNLIMDSGVRLRFAEGFEVKVVLSARQAQYPGEEEPRLFQRVRELAGPIVARGFSEHHASVIPLADPIDSTSVLDTSYEVAYARYASDFHEAADLLNAALTVARTAATLR